MGKYKRNKSLRRNRRREKLETTYKAVSIMYWDDSIEESNVACTSISDKYTKEICKEDDYWVDSNQYIGKPRYFNLSLKYILKKAWSKTQVDYFVEENMDLCDEVFNIYNPDSMSIDNRVIKYQPQQAIRESKLKSLFDTNQND